MADLNKIVEELSSLTVLEAADLAKLLEEKWGVSAAAAVAVAGLPPVALPRGLLPCAGPGRRRLSGGLRSSGGADHWHAASLRS